jgi:hypothetical protein
MNSCAPNATRPPIRRQPASLRYLEQRQYFRENITARVRALFEVQPMRGLEFTPGRLLCRGLTSKALPRHRSHVSYPPAGHARRSGVLPNPYLGFRAGSDIGWTPVVRTHERPIRASCHTGPLLLCRRSRQ